MPVAKKATKTSGTKKKAPTKKPEKVPPVSEDIPKAHVISHLALDEILPNPKNPRKTFDDAPFAELVASIREKGVLQPVIVRPLVDDTTDRRKYEIVAGERRWRASASAGAVTIPAIIRELGDQETFDIMVIENLQREDLDPLEEARAFEAYATEGGDIEDLANKIGSDPRYIRRRVRILSLPEEILTAWNEGKLSMAHLEQFMRLSRKQDVLDLYKDMNDDWQHWSVSDLKNEIDRKSPEIGNALFGAEDCQSCTMNTNVQGGLFGVDFTSEKVLCLNPKCFTKKQAAYLTDHWPETKIAQEFKTNGFRLSDDITWDKFENFYDVSAVREQCWSCEKFLSIIKISGHVLHAHVCIDKQCFRSLRSGKNDGGSNGDSGKQRVNSLGPEFQDRFYRERIPEVAASCALYEDSLLRIVALALITNSERTRSMFFDELGMKHTYAWEGHQTVWKKLEELGAGELMIWIRRVSLYLTLEDMQIGNGLSHKHLMAKHLGVDLKTEWRLHEDYLKRKTIPEILDLCKELKILTDPKAQEFAAGNLKMKTDRYDTLKKNDLIRLILESGIDLAGKVPKEILKTE
ncbi:MAG: Chromosome-partitioning protein Spo0J [Syntrophorhabdus sp. PtaB.Bin047]|nr:MAG: Chromosome-partitioning protein Spo0J [Syntrophorhabdus sp. PtaB.Bin047]